MRWSRADEFTWAYFRPAAVIDIRAGLNDRGRISAWQHTNINSGPMAIGTPYDIATFEVRYQPADSPLRTGSYRALAATANNFARESAMDELAHLAGEDPLEFRLRHLRDERLAEVCCRCPEAAGADRRSQAPVGIACGFEEGRPNRDLVVQARSLTSRRNQADADRCRVRLRRRRRCRQPA